MSRDKHLILKIALIFACFTTRCFAQQSLIQITAPANGSIITEGNTITITVAADPSIQIGGVLIDGQFPDMQAGSSSTQFLQQVPTTIRPGIYHLTAIGANSSGDVESDPISIDVEPATFPTGLVASPNFFNFQTIGHKLPVSAIATFADGSNLDVTKSSQMSYSSTNSQVATVDSTGMVTAVGPGQAVILLTYGTNPAAQSVGAAYLQVAQPPPSGTPPVVTSVTPNNGIPGTTQVTITGSGFGATQGNGLVLLGTRNAIVNSWSDTQIVAIIAPGSENGYADVEQNGLASTDVRFTMNVPIIGGLSPAQVSPGTQISIHGTGFGATQGSGFVSLGSTNAIINSWSDTQIVATVAAGTIKGQATVTQNGFTSTGVWYGIIPPVLTSLSATSLSPGMQLTLTGSGFQPAQGAGFVTLANTVGTVVSWSDAQIVITVPAGTVPGNATVTQDGAASNPLPFTMNPSVVTAISPTNLAPATQATVTGSGFGAVQGAGTVTLNNKVANVVSWSDTQIVVTVHPNTTPGNAFVTQDGVPSNGVPFTMIPAVLTSISATSLTPGMQITLTGSGFGKREGRGKVLLNNEQAIIVSWSSTQIVATVAADTTPGNAAVEQDGVQSNGIAFTMVPSTLNSISPTTFAPGAQLTLTGSGFQAAQGKHGEVLLSSLSAPIISWSDTQIVAEVPAGVVAGKAFVKQDGVKSNGLPFTVNNATLVSIAINPAGATISQGQSLQYQAIGTYSDGSTQDITAVATWTSSDSTIASISNNSGSQGLASSVTLGTVNISASFESINASTSLTVVPPSL